MNETSLAYTALIFLGAAIVMVPLVRKLGLSSVIGFILGGIIIGPFGLKLTGSDSRDIMEATEFGVIMLLFLVGLEIEPQKFWRIRRKIIGMGLGQMAVTLTVLFAIFYYAGWKTEHALVAALCFSLSSTAIVLQTLKEKNIFRTDVGEASFSILLFQDISVIPILAILPVIAHAPNPTEESELLLQYLPGWLQPFSILLGIAALILLARYLFVPFLRYVSRSGMNELLTASSLFLVIGVSELMHAVGLSAALGAFIAGLMLANSEFRHELESQIDPFKGLLLAVFFVSVGATINFSVIMHDPMFIFTATVVVLAVKFAVLMGVGKFFKLKLHENFLVAFGLSQIGEFAFVLVNYSTKLYLLDPKLNAQLMAITAITMCVTPLLLLLNEKIIEPRVHQFGKQDSPTDTPQDLKKIIIVGFGHFGSTVGRLLRVNGIKATVLDNDPERVNLLRSYDFKVYYGDASKPSILRSAGAETADLLILCLDSPEKNRLILEYAREHFPQLKIFVRAKNRLDAYEFINLGVDNIYRETLGTAVNMAVDILKATGMRAYAARRLGKRFMSIDKAMTRRLAGEEHQEKTTFTMKEYLEREAELLAEDSHSFDETQWNEYEEYQG